MYSNLSLVVLFIFVILVAKGTWNMYIKETSAARGRADVESQIASLKNREIFISDEVERLKSQNGVEREIRDKFNVKKQGEEVVVFVDSTTSLSSSGSGPSGAERAWGWLKSVFR